MVIINARIIHTPIKTIVSNKRDNLNLESHLSTSPSQYSIIYDLNLSSVSDFFFSFSFVFDKITDNPVKRNQLTIARVLTISFADQELIQLKSNLKWQNQKYNNKKKPG